MEMCEHDCSIGIEIKKCSEELVDKSFAKLKTKPYDSLSIISFYMNDFFKDKSSEDCVEELFHIKKYYILVSKTKGQYNPIMDIINPNGPKKNKSNRNNNITKPLRFMTRLRPYHYDNIANINSDGFKELINVLENRD